MVVGLIARITVRTRSTRSIEWRDAVAEVWDVSVATVVVGFGAAGACAALEAVAGGPVLVLDRFLGGGATKLSGGVVYAGGGTAAQREAGVSDDPEAMFNYLRAEVEDAVSEPT